MLTEPVRLRAADDHAPGGTRLQAHQRLFNLVVTNVPGPQRPLYLLGRELQAVYPMVPLAQNTALGIAIMSYNGQLDFGLVSDYDALAGPRGARRRAPRCARGAVRGRARGAEARPRPPLAPRDALGHVRLVWLERIAIAAASLALAVVADRGLSGYFAGHDTAAVSGTARSGCASRSGRRGASARVPGTPPTTPTRRPAGRISRRR